ncbi:hypothetical protein M2480_001295 [Parabacteroides sp. PFB2-12]|uniref:hypothetical protein n=1 Tax=unclassified Parabacteroides TaxID=2649774 RepID=UPI002473BA76|nr:MULTISPECIES: hypothetical protein [unclassified Parabacteroides]MDH6343306.1 hypothetical protein [Parabacteroides sp. PM6-13]MDH6390322.1 hypothetical protein [Parabacteroides sp. PFB2-12]
MDNLTIIKKDEKDHILFECGLGNILLETVDMQGEKLVVMDIYFPQRSRLYYGAMDFANDIKRLDFYMIINQNNIDLAINAYFDNHFEEYKRFVDVDIYRDVALMTYYVDLYSIQRANEGLDDSEKISFSTTLAENLKSFYKDHFYLTKYKMTEGIPQPYLEKYISINAPFKGHLFTSWMYFGDDAKAAGYPTCCASYKIDENTEIVIGTAYSESPKDFISKNQLNTFIIDENIPPLKDGNRIFYFAKKI